MTTPTLPVYWTAIGRDSYGSTITYEHRMPHGSLIMVRDISNNSVAIAVIFVPAEPHPGQGRP